MRTTLALVFVLMLASSVAAEDPPTKQANAREVRMVTLDTRILRMSECTARRLLGRCVPAVGGRPALLSDVGRRRILAAAERGGIELLTSPRVTIYDGQRGNVSVLNQMAYLKEYTVEGEGDAQTVTPVVATVQDGVVVDFRPFVQPDGRSVTLDLSVTLSTLQRPMAKLPLTVAGQGVEIQVPELTTHTARRLLRLRPGTHGLLRAGAGAWLLVTTSVRATQDLRGFEGANLELVPPDFQPPALPGR